MLCDNAPIIVISYWNWFKNFTLLRYMQIACCYFWRKWFYLFVNDPEVSSCVGKQKKFCACFHLIFPFLAAARTHFQVKLVYKLWFTSTDTKLSDEYWFNAYFHQQPAVVMSIFDDVSTVSFQAFHGTDWTELSYIFYLSFPG